MEFSFYAGKIMDDKLIFSSAAFSGLYAVDLVTFEVNALEKIGEKIPKEFMAKQIFAYEDILYFFPFSNFEYLKVNLKNKDVLERRIETGFYISEICKVDDSKLVISSDKPWEKMWIFDMQTETFEKVKPIIDNLNCELKEKSVVHSFSNLSGVWYIMCGGEALYHYNYNTGKGEVVNVVGEKAVAISGDEDRIILSVLGKEKLLMLDNSGVLQTCLGDEKCKYSEDDPVYGRIRVVADRILVLPGTENGKIKIININNNKTIELEYPTGFSVDKKDQYIYIFYGMEEYKGTIIVFQLSTNMLLQIDLHDNKISGHKILMSEFEMDKIIRKIVKKDGVLTEKKEFNVVDFLRGVIYGGNHVLG